MTETVLRFVEVEVQLDSSHALVEIEMPIDRDDADSIELLFDDFESGDHHLLE